MQKVWLIYHGLECGEREDCTIFYEQPEVFLDKPSFETRLEEIKKLQEDAERKKLFPHGELWTHTLELNVGEKSQPASPYVGPEYTSNDEEYDYENEEYDEEESELESKISYNPFDHFPPVHNRKSLTELIENMEKEKDHRRDRYINFLKSLRDKLE